MQQITNLQRNQTWLSLFPAFLALITALMAFQPAAAMPIEVKELVLKIPVQEVDTNGDGELEPVSGYVEAYSDGRAQGRIQIGHAFNLEMKRGIPRCVDGVNTAVLQGTLYETTGGINIAVGDFNVHVSPANGNNNSGGLDIDFDIITNANHIQPFEVMGDFFFAKPPCSS